MLVEILSDLASLNRLVHTLFPLLLLLLAATSYARHRKLKGIEARIAALEHCTEMQAPDSSVH
jgi:hypothetical protein